MHHSILILCRRKAKGYLQDLKYQHWQVINASQDPEVAGLLAGRSVIAMNQRLRKIARQQASPLAQQWCKEAERMTPEVWWGSSIASRSVSATSYFMDLFFILGCVEVFSETAEGAYLVIGDDALVLGCLEMQLRDQPQLYKNLGSHIAWQTKCLPLLWWKNTVKRIIRFLGTFSLQWLIYKASGQKPVLPTQPVTLVSTWLNDACFKEMGVYHDRCFGQWLEQQHLKPEPLVILPLVFDWRQGQRQLLKHLQASQYRLWLPAMFCSLLDPWRELWRALQIWSFKADHVLPVASQLLRYKFLWRDAIDASLMTFNLTALMLKRLKACGFEVQRYIYPMENHQAEKYTLLATHKLFPKAQTIGYQHTVWYLDRLSMHNHAVEKAPLPEVIWYTGPVYKEVLQQCGFEQRCLKPFPNYRFQPMKSRACQAPAKSLLVILNYNPVHAVQLLEMVYEAHRGLFETVYVKAHPLNPTDLVVGFIKRSQGQSAWHQVTESVAVLLNQVSAVVVGGASVCVLEAILAQRPVYRVSVGEELYLDPLWTPYPIDISWTAKDLQVAWQKFDQQEIEYDYLADQVVEKYFFSPESVDEIMQ